MPPAGHNRIYTTLTDTTNCRFNVGLRWTRQREIGTDWGNLLHYGKPIIHCLQIHIPGLHYQKWV